MKQLAITFIFLITSITFANNNSQSSKIEDVTVFLKGAQVTRTAKIEIPSGSTELIFSDLSPHIQENSIQVSGLKNASILSINYGINFLLKPKGNKSIESLKLQLEALSDKIQAEDNLITGYNEELNILQHNRQIGSDKMSYNIEKLQQFATYYRERTTAIKNSITISNKKRSSFYSEIEDIKKQLNEYNVEEKIKTGEIILKLNSAIATKLDLEISYNVDNAGWFPVYDLKAKDVDRPLHLTYKAHVYQNTGQDWNEANLTLSTSDPNTNNIKPDINPKYLNFVNSSYKAARAVKKYNYSYNPTINKVSGTVLSSEDGLPLPGVNVIVKGTTNGTQTDYNGNYSISINEGDTLEFSFIGMVAEELPIHSSVMNISLDSDLSQLEEVAIVGYSNNRPKGKTAASIDEVLSGKIAGLQIRGISSISAGEEPLYIFDGVQMSAEEISNLDSNDIGEISVLKDAAQIAMYGARANNGVVLISSKNGSYAENGNFIDESISNITFKIKKPYTISSNEDITSIEIETYSIPATYSYYVAPVLNENVFLTAKIEDFEQYNLLPAEANVYFEGSYTGKTEINPYKTSEVLNISLGVDPNVIVKREQPEDYKKRAFIGSNKIIEKAFEIEIKNNKAATIDLVLYDRIPISQNKAIKVEDVETGSSDYDEDKGLLKWSLKLEPNSKSTKTFSYTLRYPKYKYVNL